MPWHGGAWPGTVGLAAVTATGGPKHRSVMCETTGPGHGDMGTPGNGASWARIGVGFCACLISALQSFQR